MASLKDMRDPDRQRAVDAEDHQGHEDGGGRQAAPRAGAGRGGAALCRAHGGDAGQPGAAASPGMPGAPPLLAGTGSDKVHLLVVATSDRGLAGGFNSSIVRGARERIGELLAEGKTVKLLPSAARARDQLRRDYRRPDRRRPSTASAGKRRSSSPTPSRIGRSAARAVRGRRVRRRHDRLQPLQVGDDARSSTVQQLIPAERRRRRRGRGPASGGDLRIRAGRGARSWPTCCRATSRSRSSRALLENAASVHGAQMTAMDNATRNAGDMINRTDPAVNRSRQAQITKELIEIISGAEAV